MFKSKVFGDCNSWKITEISLGFHETKAALEEENISQYILQKGKNTVIMINR